MDKLESIDAGLNEIRKMLDTIAQDILNSELRCSSAHFKNLGEALKSISDIQHE